MLKITVKQRVTLLQFQSTRQLGRQRVQIKHYLLKTTTSLNSYAPLFQKKKLYYLKYQVEKENFMYTVISLAEKQTIFVMVGVASAVLASYQYLSVGLSVPVPVRFSVSQCVQHPANTSGNGSCREEQSICGRSWNDKGKKNKNKTAAANSAVSLSLLTPLSALQLRNAEIVL